MVRRHLLDFVRAEGQRGRCAADHRSDDAYIVQEPLKGARVPRDEMPRLVRRSLVIGAYDQVEAELLFEIRQLARDMIRMEDWARDAAERRRFDRVAELHWQRELALERRSRLMREFWRNRRQ